MVGMGWPPHQPVHGPDTMGPVRHPGGESGGNVAVSFENALARFLVDNVVKPRRCKGAIFLRFPSDSD